MIGNLIIGFISTSIKKSMIIWWEKSCAIYMNMLKSKMKETLRRR